MKLISLNTWGGKVGKEKLSSFFNKHKDVDIFCLQEIWSDPNVTTFGMKEVLSILPGHLPFFHPCFDDKYGLLILIKNDQVILDVGDIFVHREKGFMPQENDNHARNIQYATLDVKTGPITLINFHGLWTGKGKIDTEDRLSQSTKIVQFLKTLNTKVVLSGDFNLLPATKSIKIIEDFGLKNLIKEYNIMSTRTSFYTRPDKHADYCFVSKDIKVKEFKVLSDEVSDHAPLYIEFE